VNQKTGTSYETEEREATVNEVDQGTSRNEHLVSIIIPTLNSERTMARCLQSVKNQTHKYIETIVVDKYSNDKTASIAQYFSARLFLKDSERSAARNFGVRNAKGSFAFFLDSDMELTPDIVQQCIAACLAKGAEAVIIPEESIANGFLSECRRMEKKMHFGDRFFEAPRFFNKEIIQKVGGYNESLIYGEDFDLYIRIQKAGYKTCRVQSKIMHHEGELSMKEIVLKANRYGKSLLLFVRKNPSIAMKKHRPVIGVHIRNIELAFNDPTHFTGLIIIKIAEYIAYFTGILTSILDA